MTKHQKRIERIELVRLYLLDHLGATAKDVTRDLGFKYSTACDYVEVIRLEWRSKPKEKQDA